MKDSKNSLCLKIVTDRKSLKTAKKHQGHFGGTSRRHCNSRDFRICWRHNNPCDWDACFY